MPCRAAPKAAYYLLTLLGATEGKGALTLADPGSGVAAGRALALLHVKGAPTAAAAQRVGLVPTLTERSGTLACLTHGG
eukprot:1611229-Pyramimonas_sp.AAC.1